MRIKGRKARRRELARYKRLGWKSIRKLARECYGKFVMVDVARLPGKRFLVFDTDLLGRRSVQVHWTDKNGFVQNKLRLPRIVVVGTSVDIDLRRFGPIPFGSIRPVDFFVPGYGIGLFPPPPGSK